LVSDDVGADNALEMGKFRNLGGAEGRGWFVSEGEPTNKVFWREKGKLMDPAIV
jgi:hypothetical protein